MLEAREVFGSAASEICEKFSLTAKEDERVFALIDGDKRGVGLTRFCGGVRIRAFLTDGDNADRECLFRTLLLDATRMSGYKAYIEQDGDYSKYGFTKVGGEWIADCDKIIFPHDCKKEI